MSRWRAFGRELAGFGPGEVPDQKSEKIPLAFLCGVVKGDK